MKHIPLIVCMIAVMVIAIAFSINAQSSPNPMPTVSIEKPTKVIIYSGGCFDAKAGSKYLLRCV